MYIDLRTKRGYDIATALVGSGTEGFPILKWLITGSIRAACGVDSRICNIRLGKVGEKLSPFTRDRLLSEVRRLRCQLPKDRTLGDVMNHWVGHAVEAMNSLPSLRDTWERDFTVVLGSTIHKPHLEKAWNTLEEMLK